MANNRMYLVNTRTGAKFMLAKYYPSTGWSIDTEGDVGANLGDYFYEQDFGPLESEQPENSLAGMYGREYILEFDE